MTYQYSEGNSHNGGLDLVASWLPGFPVQRAVDFACGAGKLGQTVRQAHPGVYLVGADIWAPTIARRHQDQPKVYDKLLLGDMRKLAPKQVGPWDLWVFGDCLEHVPKEDALALLNASPAERILVRIPVGPYPQPADANPAEEHLWSFYPSDWKLVNRDVEHAAIVHIGHGKRPPWGRVTTSLEDSPEYEVPKSYMGNFVLKRRE